MPRQERRFCCEEDLAAIGYDGLNAEADLGAGTPVDSMPRQVSSSRLFRRRGSLGRDCLISAPEWAPSISRYWKPAPRLRLTSMRRGSFSPWRGLRRSVEAFRTGSTIATATPSSWRPTCRPPTSSRWTRSSAAIHTSLRCSRRLCGRIRVSSGSRTRATSGGCALSCAWPTFRSGSVASPGGISFIGTLMVNRLMGDAGYANVYEGGIRPWRVVLYRSIDFEVSP